jgi:hypothetical protein
MGCKVGGALRQENAQIVARDNRYEHRSGAGGGASRPISEG